MSSEALTKKQAKRRGWTRFILYLFLIILGFLFGGFISFANIVSNLRPQSPPPIADGIVVWTGKGGDRLSTAGNLIKNGHGERLLVSGVNKSTSSEDVYDLLMISDEKSACCVDLDYKALDTIGNARETDKWLTVLGYEHIILVTSAYHMPRAQIEIGALSGRVRITPYPVAYDPAGPWWKDGVQFRRLLQEYGKLLLTYLRQSGNKNQREAPQLSELPEKPAVKDPAESAVDED